MIVQIVSKPTIAAVSICYTLLTCILYIATIGTAASAIVANIVALV